MTVEEEEMLWHRGLLGDPSSQVLLDTMVYYCGLYFALRTGKEHRQLRNSPCQIEVVERSGEKAYLWYTEDVSKNHQGGLNGRKVKPKVVLHHANPLTVALCDSFGSTGNTVHQMLRQVPSTSSRFRNPLRPAGTRHNLWATPHLGKTIG